MPNIVDNHCSLLGSITISLGAGHQLAAGQEQIDLQFIETGRASLAQPRHGLSASLACTEVLSLGTDLSGWLGGAAPQNYPLTVGPFKVVIAQVAIIGRPVPHFVTARDYDFTVSFLASVGHSLRNRSTKRKLLSNPDSR